MVNEKNVGEKFKRDVQKKLQKFQKSSDRLKDMELFVLDNSLRETTVASIQAHTLENKYAIYEEIKKVGFKYFFVESFSTQTRLGDLFLEELIKKGEDLSGAFAFSELWEVCKNGVPQDDIPIGLIKCKKFGIKNVMLEFDLVWHSVNYNVFTMPTLCQYLKSRIDWIRANLSKESMIFTNLRDFSNCMVQYPERVYQLVNFLSSLPEKERITGLAYEDLGKSLPEEIGAWTSAVRKEMDRRGWKDGHFIIHVHEQWGMGHSTQLNCLAMGATGIWAGVCAEGAALGHADSTTTILNMIRLGNTAVQKQFNCNYLREAARNVTLVTTEVATPPRTPIYGDRAVDLVFGFIFSDPTAKSGFDMCKFFGLEPDVRITTMASPEMILLKLEKVFGKSDIFNMDIATAMKEQILKNASDNRKEEYNSKVGLALLFDQAGGKMTPEMAAVVDSDMKTSQHIDKLIAEIKEEWDEWDGKDGEIDDQVTFDHFYNGFMAPYFGCYRCEDSQKGLKCLDMDSDGMVDWNEFKFYLKWAGREYHDVKNKKELLDMTFRKGLIPAMKDEIVKLQK